MNIWLDDERTQPEDWVRVKTVEKLIELFEKYKNQIITISLDHDLGENQKTGYDFLLWLECEIYNNAIKQVPDIRIHSANPVGRKNMELVLTSIRRKLKT